MQNLDNVVHICYENWMRRSDCNLSLIIGSDITNITVYIVCLWGGGGGGVSTPLLHCIYFNFQNNLFLNIVILFYTWRCKTK